MHSLSLISILSLTSLPQTLAWGTLGHETVAWLAQNLISDTTTTYVQDILQSTTSDYIANISTWADTIRYTEGNAWTAPLHYIDAADSPPGQCDVEFDRDCGEGGCVVSAIVNYTSILLSSAPAAEKRDAMRFLVHFVGDIHQPLHVEGLEEGGNGINVTFDGDETNLHHIWDTEIVEKIAGTENAEDWATELISLVNDGGSASNGTALNPDAWTEGIDISDVEKTAMGWASDANSFVCSDVLPDGEEAVEEGDLADAYFQAHGEVARVQITKAGYRLAKFLDLVAEGASGSSGDNAGGDGGEDDGDSGSGSVRA
jgi:hypothetical protein